VFFFNFCVLNYLKMVNYRSGISRRKSVGNMRASFNQNDSCNIVLRHKMNIQCGQYLEAIELHADPFFADNELLDKNIITIRNTGCAFVNIYEVIRNSDYFKNISEIYDQIKINAIKVDVTSVDWPQSSPDDGTNSGFVYPKQLTLLLLGIELDYLKKMFNLNLVNLIRKVQYI